MQTLVDLPGATAAPTANPQVTAYAARLQRAQQAYLDALGDALTTLPASAHHAREMAALQGRLARRFFDAQRAIIARRAEVDDEISRLVGRTDYLPPSGIDGGRFERQLDALLDEWWRSEQRACEVASREAVVTTGEHPLVTWRAAADAGVDPDAVEMVDALPQDLLRALDAADPTALSRVIDDLVADLDAHLALAAATAAPIAVARPGDLVLVGEPDEHDERFRTFWPAAAPELALDEDADEDRRMAVLASRVVLPMVAVTAGLALALALIG